MIRIYYMDEEEWKPFKYKKEYTGYSISSFGRVRNDKTGRILKQFIQNNGRYGFTISVNNKPHSFKISRCVAELFIPNPNNLPEVDHIDPDQSDNYVDNLEWVTSEENKRRAKYNELYKGKKGELNHSAIYNETIIRKICDHLVENELSFEKIAKKCKCTRNIVYDIYAQRRWTHISKDYDFSNYDYDKHNKVDRTGENNGFCKYTDETIHNVCKLLEENKKTIGEISKLTGVKNSAILDILHKGLRYTISSQYNIANYDMLPSGYHQKDLDKMDELIKEGKTTKEICNILKFPYNQKLICLVSKHRKRVKMS